MNLRECEARHLANIWRVSGPSGSLQKAGGDGWWAFLDQLPETGGAMSGSQIGSLAFFPQCQVELLSSPTGKKGGDIKPPKPVSLSREQLLDLFTWLGGTSQRC